MKTYGPPADRDVARPRLPGLGHRGARVPGCPGRHRRQHAGPCPPEAWWPRCSEQVGQLIHCSNYYQVPLQEELAAAVRAVGTDQRVLLQLRPGGQRGALKIARKYGHDVRASTPRSSWCTRRPSTAVRSPRCRPPATPRCRPASSRWCRASCACPERHGGGARRWTPPERQWRCSWRPSRAKAASTRRAWDYLRVCVRSATSADLCC
jgi:hypothetical protein